MGSRLLTDEERELLQKNGILPDPMRVHYRSECALHLVNLQTGAEITLHLTDAQGGGSHD